MKLNKIYFTVMLGLALSCMSGAQAKSFHHTGSFDPEENGSSSQSLLIGQQHNFFEENDKFELSDSKHFDDEDEDEYEGDDDECWSDHCMPSAVPEPETYIMMLTGLGLLGFMSRRRKS
jgi:hypothetical protein